MNKSKYEQKALIKQNLNKKTKVKKTYKANDAIKYFKMHVPIKNAVCRLATDL